MKEKYTVEYSSNDDLASYPYSVSYANLIDTKNGILRTIHTYKQASWSYCERFSLSSIKANMLKPFAPYAVNSSLVIGVLSRDKWDGTGDKYNVVVTLKLADKK